MKKFIKATVETSLLLLMFVLLVRAGRWVSTLRIESGFLEAVCMVIVLIVFLVSMAAIDAAFREKNDVK